MRAPPSILDQLLLSDAPHTASQLADAFDADRARAAPPRQRSTLDTLRTLGLRACRSYRYARLANAGKLGPRNWANDVCVRMLAERRAAAVLAYLEQRHADAAAKRHLRSMLRASLSVAA